ncbi:MAG: hypothetical protein NCW75_10555 [Phycisphaera sp.]|nr:MAG: hypothetical protein NCW75_10555 [Phycisphaera sp.]
MNPNQDDTPTNWTEARLGDADAQAVDRWMAGEAPGDARDQRLAELLGLLNAESAISADATLTDLTMLRIMRATGSQAITEVPDETPELTPMDAEALDAWMLAGGRVERVPAALRERAQKLHGLATLVSQGPEPEVSGDMVDRLMTKVAETPTKRSETEPQPEIAGRIRMADLMSIAAVLVVGVSVIWPMLTSMREAHYKTISSARMAAAGNGMAAYASNYGSLPQASASLAGNPWWEVGENPEHSNSANLFTLASAGFVEIAQLASPTNPQAPTSVKGEAADDWRSLDEVSYSYRNMFGGQNRAFDITPTSALLADRSPIVPPSRRGEAARADANSRNFGGRGQHVLFGDGSVAWLNSPILDSGDNIWLPASVERDLERDGRATLRGRETADGPADAFLVP